MSFFSRSCCAVLFTVCLGILSNLFGELRPEWKFSEGDFAPMFPFKVEKGAPDNITNIQTWGTPWVDTKNGDVLSTHDAQFYRGEIPFHFVGTNLCFDANFCEHADADRLAETLSRFGIRVVRLHHMDRDDIWGKNYSRTKTEIDPEQLDKLDYLIAQFHKRGIYVNMNLHVSRAFDERDGFEDSKTLPAQCKGVDNFEPRMIELQKKYARDLLTHINPYTGYPYTDDPGVAMIEINNENSVVASWYWGALDTLGPTYAACLREKWSEWLLKKYGSTEKCLATYSLKDQEPGEEQIKSDSIPEQLNPNTAVNGWMVQSDQSSKQKIDILTDSSGKRTIKLAVDKSGKNLWIPQIVRASLAVQKGSFYTVSFRMKTNRPTKIFVSVTENHSPWENVGFREMFQTGTDGQTERICFQATKDDDNIRLSFSQIEPGIELELSDVSFQKRGDFAFKPDERIETGTFPILAYGDAARKMCEPLHRDFIHFLVDLESGYWAEMYHFVKDVLRSKPPVTGTQYQYGSWYAQEQTDYGDNHSYWQHPKFPNKSWDANDWYINNKAMTNNKSGGSLSRLAYNRVIGKAYTVSEYDHPYPNFYGAEGNLMAAAIAAFQGWSGFYQFAWSHNVANLETDVATTFFDMCGNQAKMVHLPACYAMLERRDVQSGPGRYVSVQDITRSMERDIMFDLEEGWNPITNQYISDETLALVCWGGVNLSEAPSAVTLPADKIYVDCWDDLPVAMGRPKDGEIWNEFGQLRWNTKDEKGFFTVDTPGVKVFTGFVNNRSFDFHGLTLTPGKTRLDWTTVSITAATAPDSSNPERLSPGRYLIAATGLVQNTDAKFIAYEEGKITVGRPYGGSNGHEPVLCEGIPLTVTLNKVDSEKITVYALDVSGNRKELVPVTKESGAAQFSLGPEYQTLWYELVIAE